MDGGDVVVRPNVQLILNAIVYVEKFSNKKIRWMDDDDDKVLLQQHSIHHTAHTHTQHDKRCRRIAERETTTTTQRQQQQQQWRHTSNRHSVWVCAAVNSIYKWMRKNTTDDGWMRGKERRSATEGEGENERDDGNNYPFSLPLSLRVLFVYYMTTTEDTKFLSHPLNGWIQRK